MVAACVLCLSSRVFRRGLCRSCLRKLTRAGALPPHRGGAGEQLGAEVLDAMLRRWLARWEPSQREALRAALVRLDGGDGR